MPSDPLAWAGLWACHRKSAPLCLSPYSGKLSREKTFTNWWNMRFREENYRGFATDRISAWTHPQSMNVLCVCVCVCVYTQYIIIIIQCSRVCACTLNPCGPRLFSRRKLSRLVIPDPRNSQRFSPSKVSRYTVLDPNSCRCVCPFCPHSRVAHQPFCWLELQIMIII